MSTARMIDVGGYRIMTPNKITRNERDFHVSYNNHDVAIYGSDTTALVHYTKDREYFYILDGNHTAEYHKLKTFEDCFDYFKNHIILINKHSDKLDGAPVCGDVTQYTDSAATASAKAYLKKSLEVYIPF
jgi:hypothetical protein